MRHGLPTGLPGSILVVLTMATPSVFGQPIALGGVRGPVPGAAAPLGPGPAGGFGYGGGYYPYPNLFLNYPGGYGYGGYDPTLAAVPSTAYLTLGNTSYTTESPSPLPVYVPRPAFVPLPPPLPLTALLKLQVPPDAEIWLEGRKMRSTGLMRHYRTPPLDPTKEYAYEIRARWRFNDKPVDDVRHVSIRAGATIQVDFTHLDPLVPRPSVPAPPPAPAAPANPSPS
jgi:uncharacterized protein (TIGR03000 family)